MKYWYKKNFEAVSSTPPSPPAQENFEPHFDEEITIRVMEGEKRQITGLDLGHKTYQINYAEYLIDGVAKWWFSGSKLMLRVNETEEDTYTLAWAQTELQRTGEPMATFKITLEVEAYESDNNLVGTNHKDKIDAEEGADQIDGLGGHDVLIGGLGNDTILGSRGRDVITGSEGDDTLTGGAGRDVFVFDTTSGTDTLMDFNFTLDTATFNGVRLTAAQELSLIHQIDDHWIFDAAEAAALLSPAAAAAI